MCRPTEARAADSPLGGFWSGMLPIAPVLRWGRANTVSNGSFLDQAERIRLMLSFPGQSPEQRLGGELHLRHQFRYVLLETTYCTANGIVVDVVALSLAAVTTT